MSTLLYVRDETSSTVVKPPLSQAVGYIVVVGIGLLIALGTSEFFVYVWISWPNS
jgi:hypothetical protein